METYIDVLLCILLTVVTIATVAIVIAFTVYVIMNWFRRKQPKNVRPSNGKGGAGKRKWRIAGRNPIFDSSSPTGALRGKRCGREWGFFERCDKGTECASQNMRERLARRAFWKRDNRSQDEKGYRVRAPRNVTAAGSYNKVAGSAGQYHFKNFSPRSVRKNSCDKKGV